MEPKLIFRLKINYYMQLALADDRIVFFANVPDTPIFIVCLLLGMGLVFLTMVPVFNEATFAYYLNDYFAGALVAIWLGILSLAMFGPILWESNRISKMKANDFEHLIQKRSNRKNSIKYIWEEVEHTILCGDRVQLIFLGEVTGLEAKLKQIYSYEVSTGMLQSSSFPPEVQLQHFLLKKLGSRLLEIDQDETPSMQLLSQDRLMKNSTDEGRLRKTKRIIDAVLIAQIAAVFFALILFPGIPLIIQLEIIAIDVILAVGSWLYAQPLFRKLQSRK